MYGFKKDHLFLILRDFLILSLSLSLSFFTCFILRFLSLSQVSELKKTTTFKGIWKNTKNREIFKKRVLQNKFQTLYYYNNSNKFNLCIYVYRNVYMYVKKNWGLLKTFARKTRKSGKFEIQSELLSL